MNISFGSLGSEAYACSVRNCYVGSIPSDDLKVEVELKHSSTTIIKTNMFAVNGSIQLTGLADILNTYLEQHHYFIITVSASAKYTISGTATTATTSINVCRCKIPFTSETSYASLIANSFLTLHRSRVVPRGFNMSVIYNAPSLGNHIVGYRFYYSDGTSSTYAAAGSHQPGNNALVINYDTLATHATAGKKICSIYVALGQRTLTLYISDASMTAVTYVNVFGMLEYCYLAASSTRTIDKEYEMAYMDDETKRLYDVRTTAKVELVVAAISNTDNNILREIISLGNISLPDGDYIITEHTWSVSDAPSTVSEIILSLEPVSDIYSIRNQTNDGIFSVEYDSVYE